MLNICSIVVAILKMATGRNFSMSAINSGYHYQPTYQILMISGNVEFLPPIFDTVFWQPFWRWQTSKIFKMQNCSSNGDLSLCQRSEYDKGRFWPNLRNCLYRYNIKHIHWKVRFFIFFWWFHFVLCCLAT